MEQHPTNSVKLNEDKSWDWSVRAACVVSCRFWMLEEVVVSEDNIKPFEVKH